ncbi:uncharacterized protein LOC143766334 isoform X2 [Ranitomeya variabilis]|uniref:uncharacterized protein LOC143766334 isoform X2 n=1 Tax=Ranitomeya variabilis TaxID=490064 RepID=UPI0040566436
MDMDRDKMVERILHLTLEILFRLTGEDYTVVKKTSNNCCQAPESEGRGRPLSPIMGPPPHPLIHEDVNDQKILELTYKMIELLTGEVPLRCQDVAVYFSMEEWEYLEGHKDLYEDITMEVPQSLTSPDLSSKTTTPERCPRPLLPQDCKQEPNIPQDHQGEDLTHINTTETYVWGDEWCKVEIPTYDYPGARSKHCCEKNRMVSYDRMSINVHRLILLVRNRPILWDPSCDHYHNRFKRDNAWDKVVNKLYPECLGMLPERKNKILKDVRTRWRSVRDRFKKNVHDQERSGSSPKPKKCPYYDDLQFLLNTRELRITEGNIPTPECEIEKGQDQGSRAKDSNTIISSCKDTEDQAATVRQTSMDCTQNVLSRSQGRPASKVSQVTRRQAIRRRQQVKENIRQNAEPAADTQKAMCFLHCMDSNDNWDYFCASIASGFRKVPPENQWSCASVVCGVVHVFQKYRHSIDSCEIVTGIKEIAERQLTSQNTSSLQQPSTLNYPAPHAPSFPAPHSLSFPAPHTSSFPAPQSSSFPAPQSSSFPAPQSSSFPAPHSLSFPAPHSSSFPAPHSSSFPAPQSSSFPAPHSSSFPAPHSSSFPAPHSSSIRATCNSATPNSAFLQTSTLLASLHSPLSTASSSQPDFLQNFSSHSDSATSMAPTGNLPDSSPPTFHTFN